MNLGADNKAHWLAEYAARFSGRLFFCLTRRWGTLIVAIRCLSKSVKRFLHFKMTLFTQDPQGFHKPVPMPTTTSLPSCDPRLASAARYLFSS